MGTVIMPFTQLAGASAAAKALAPTACTTIEEVGSTGVGALTLGFLALAVSTVVMVAKAASADAERREYYFCNTFICGVATFSYFAMLSGQGWTATAGYMGAVSVVTTVKWFWFLFGMAMFLPVIYSLARTFRETVITRKDPEMIELYGKIAWLTIIMWSFYPVVWLFSEGFASFSVSFEVVAYTILDIISKVVFSFMIVSAHDSLGSTSAPQMQSREYV